MKTYIHLELRAGRCDKRKSNWYQATGTIQPWIRDIRKIPILSREEERELALRAKEGDLQARNELVTHNIRLAVWAAQYFDCPPGVQFDDIIQEGIMGLINAASLYDPDREASFAGYALFGIEGRIRRYLDRYTADPGLMIEMPSHASIMIQRIRKLKEEAYKETGDSYVSRWDLRRNLNASDELINEVIRFTNIDIIEDEDIRYDIPDDYPGTEELAMSRVCQKECLDIINTIPEKEARILCMRIGMPPYTKTYTLDELGKIYGVSRERVRQIEAKAYRRLRNPKRLRRFR